jgi:hypothetical protein
MTESADVSPLRRVARDEQYFGLDSSTPLSTPTVRATCVSLPSPMLSFCPHDTKCSDSESDISPSSPLLCKTWMISSPGWCRTCHSSMTGTCRVWIWLRSNCSLSCCGAFSHQAARRPLVSCVQCDGNHGLSRVGYIKLGSMRASRVHRATGTCGGGRGRLLGLELTTESESRQRRVN